MADRSMAVVLAVAVATGVLAATSARAFIGGAGERVLAAGASGVAAQSPPPETFTRDEIEHEEPHITSDNPYEEPAPAARPSFERVQLPSRDGMLRLPGGRFVMGSSSAHAPPNERPARTVALPAFWIDRTEVTVGAYRACVSAGACAVPPKASATCTFDAGDGELPISCVHWRDADAYCHFAHKRLPSEREWEYAARGSYAMAFPWGGVSGCGTAITLLNDQSGRSCAPRPARVGTHLAGASVFGVLDLSGNVEEWTGDWYVESLGPGPAPRSGAAHVLRGGGWLSSPSQSRTTSRDWGSSLEAGPNVGFRCARDS
jgi:serine/threonine-protein kinase